MKKIFTYFVLLFSFGTLMLATPAFAASNDQIFASCSQTPDSPVCKDKNTKTNPVTHILKVAVDIVALLTGVAAVVIIIVGGVTMVTSAGNAEALANARKRITSALIGLVIVALAWTVISFVIDKLIK